MVFNLDSEPKNISKNLLNFKKYSRNVNLNNILLTFRLKNSEPVRLILSRNYINKPILHNLNTNIYSILSLRFDKSVYLLDIIIYGDLKDNILYIHSVKVGDNNLLKSIEIFDQILYSKYKVDIELENLEIKFKEFYGDRLQIINLEYISDILYINNNMIDNYIENIK